MANNNCSRHSSSRVYHIRIIMVRQLSGFLAGGPISRRTFNLEMILFYRHDTRNYFYYFTHTPSVVDTILIITYPLTSKSYRLPAGHWV